MPEIPLGIPKFIRVYCVLSIMVGICWHCFIFSRFGFSGKPSFGSKEDYGILYADTLRAPASRHRLAFGPQFGGSFDMSPYCYTRTCKNLDTELQIFRLRILMFNRASHFCLAHSLNDCIKIALLLNVWDYVWYTPSFLA